MERQTSSLAFRVNTTIFDNIIADVDTVPVVPSRDDWFVHKELLSLAREIHQVLHNEMILPKVINHDYGTAQYDVIIVGHSLGAGVAAILAVLLHQDYPTLHCYAYSPPGCLMSASCVEETKSFITSVVVGEDVLLRLGANQLDSFQQEFVNELKKSNEPKWKIIISGMLETSGRQTESATSVATASREVTPRTGRGRDRQLGRYCRNGGSPMLLALQTPLYPPGNVVHIVRSHPKHLRRMCRVRREVIFQAIWTDNASFDQILVSPTMFSDHSLEVLFNAMKMALARASPSKPSRKPMKPSREELIGSVDASASHFTMEDPVEHDCILASTSDGPRSEYAQVCVAAPPHDVVDVCSATQWNCESTVVLKRHGTADRGLRARSFPPAAVDDWLSLAPLASPETLSESSSLASCSSSAAALAGLTGYQRIMSSVLPPRMDPILQSPARSSNSHDCCLHLESADVAGDLATLSPCVENLPLPLTPHQRNPDIVPVSWSVTVQPNSDCSSSHSPDVVPTTSIEVSLEQEANDSQNPIAYTTIKQCNNRLSSDGHKTGVYAAVEPDVVFAHNCCEDADSSQVPADL